MYHLAPHIHSISHHISIDRIGATILSHHTDDFTLVSAFLLFSIGCLNMILGLIFRDSAKTKRSLLNWREQAKGILPIGSPTPSFLSSTLHGGEKPNDTSSEHRTGNANAAGFGFGRQGEQTAGLKGEHGRASDLFKRNKD
jgi:hypothetical protein